MQVLESWIHTAFSDIINNTFGAAKGRFEAIGIQNLM